MVDHAAAAAAKLSVEREGARVTFDVIVEPMPARPDDQ
jgi:hypothetical protein